MEAQELPKTQNFDLYEPGEGSRMEFRLIYNGPLPPEKWSYKQEYARAIDKHKLRKHFHLQLRELWKKHPDLSVQAETLFLVYENPRRIVVVPASLRPPTAKTWIDVIADDHTRCGGRFVPLISKTGGFTCSLDITFLRRGGPGDLVSSGGDIDSRMKVLLDGLTMPQQVQELGGLPITEDENPFFVLLGDDSLISSMAVTTDRLLTPVEPEEKINDVHIVVRVTVVNPGAIFAGGRLV